jgi:Tfp pilus assembly protein PilV
VDLQRGDSPPGRRGVRRDCAGMTLIELMIAACVLVLASLSLAYAFTTSGLSSQQSDRALNVRAPALTTTQESARRRRL